MVIAHFGSNFLKISCDFADLRIKNLPTSKYTPDIYLGIYHSSYLPGIYLKIWLKVKTGNTQGIYLSVFTLRFLLYP